MKAMHCCFRMVLRPSFSVRCRQTSYAYFAHRHNLGKALRPEKFVAWRISQCDYLHSPSSLWHNNLVCLNDWWNELCCLRASHPTQSHYSNWINSCTFFYHIPCRVGPPPAVIWSRRNIRIWIRSSVRHLSRNYPSRLHRMARGANAYEAFVVCSHSYRSSHSFSIDRRRRPDTDPDRIRA